MNIFYIRIIIVLLFGVITSCGSQNNYLSDWEDIEKIYNDSILSNKDSLNKDTLNKDTLNKDTTNKNPSYYIGLNNAIKNIKQLCDISYILTNNLRCETKFTTGSNLKGLIYSSSRYEDLFVPNNVSFWTYLSAASDPNSYFYTRDISTSPYNIRGQAHAYYGQVCSSAIQYALGIKYNFQMIQMHLWDGMELISSQIIDSIKPGVIFMSKGHVMMCIDVERNKDGTIQNATIAEGNAPLARYSKYNESSLNDFINKKGYQLYNYKYINNTKLITSPFTSPDGVINNSFSFNRNIMPRRGDKANWRKDENVEIDVLAIDSYHAYKLFKNDSIISTVEINPSIQTINLGVLEYGSYKMCLTNGTKDSEYVYWIVVDYDIHVEKHSDYTATVSFHSNNAKPFFLTWRLPHSDSGSSNNMPEWTVPISKEEADANKIITRIAKEVIEAHPRKKWDISVHFETEYGILKSDNVTIDFSN